MVQAGLGDYLRPAVAAGTCTNVEAAAVSLPSMLRKEMAVDRARWVWRTPLEKSEPYWCALSPLPGTVLALLSNSPGICTASLLTIIDSQITCPL
jgi:hypothetical protein